MERDPDDGSVSGNRAPAFPRPHEGAGWREAPARRIEYVRPAEVTTLGVDPLVSNASVIHELSFGRIPAGFTGTESGRNYPVSKEEMPHVLDLFV